MGVGAVDGAGLEKEVHSSVPTGQTVEPGKKPAMQSWYMQARVRTRDSESTSTSSTSKFKLKLSERPARSSRRRSLWVYSEPYRNTRD